VKRARTDARRAYDRDWKRRHYAANSEARLEYRRAQYAANREQEKAREKARYERDRDKRLAQKRASYASNRDVASTRRRKAHFGLSGEQFAEVLKSQGGRCAICRTQTPGGRGGWHVDHRHDFTPHDKRGHRGLLCHACNVALGLLKDDPDITYAAAGYLNAWNDRIARRLRPTPSLAVASAQ
jgi:hypothetical protein